MTTVTMVTLAIDTNKLNTTFTMTIGLHVQQVCTVYNVIMYILHNNNLFTISQKNYHRKVLGLLGYEHGDNLP